MGILIKGVKMPDCCWNCPCVDGEYGECNFLGKTIKCGNGRLADCPLVELPDHGDLIERDEAADDACFIWCRNSAGDDAVQEIIEHLREMKAVIPAERSEE